MLSSSISVLSCGVVIPIALQYLSILFNQSVTSVARLNSFGILAIFGFSFFGVVVNNLIATLAIAFSVNQAKSLLS